MVRIDHQAGPNDNLSGHYAIDDVDENNPFGLTIQGGEGNLPGFGNIISNRGQNLGISWTHIATPRVVNEFRFGFNRFSSLTSHANAGVNGNQQLGFPEVLTDPRDLGFPGIDVAGFEILGDPPFLPLDVNPTTIQFSDNLVWLPEFHGGRHQIKFGADIRRVGSKNFSDFFARGEWDFLGVATGSSLADLLLGFPAFAVGVRGDSFDDIRTGSLSLYLQDDVRVTSRLTLNLGLRYEYNQPPRESRNRFSVPDLSDNSITCTPKPDCQFFPAGSNGIPRGTYSNDLNNFAPRFGLAWRPLPTERFVVRAGYGIFYDVSVFTRSFLMTINPPIYTLAVSLNNGTNTIQDILDQPRLRPNSSRVSPDVRDAYMQHWNLNLQYEWLQDLLLDIAYVGSKGTKLGAARDINQIDPATGTQPFPQFARIDSYESRASSNYHSLQLRAEQRLRSGMPFLASYTWSKSIDDSSSLLITGAERSLLPQDSNNLKAQRGLSSFHAKHRFVLSYLYELPIGQGRRWLNYEGWVDALAGGWKLGGISALQSGQPFTVHRSLPQSGSGTAPVVPADRPDQIVDPFQAGPVPGHPDPACQSTISQGGRAADEVRTPSMWFNPCAFAAAPGRFGTAPRNSVLGPNFRNLDFSVLKDIPLPGETHRLQFRFEVFNVLNRPNFDLPVKDFDSLTFGRVLSSNAFTTRPPRQIQFALKYIF